MPIVLNGTTGITNDSGYTGDGVSFADSTPANTLVTTAGGNVGIGTSSPSSLCDIRGSSNGQNVLQLSNSAGSSDGGAENQIRVTCNGNTNWGNLDIQAYTTIFTQNGTERARIASSGELLLGASSIIGSGRVRSTTFDANQVCYSSWGSVNYTAFQMVFNSSQVGTIACTASTTAYNTSSDYRLKHDIQPMTGALAKVAALKPVTYKWNADDSQSQGFIAHELQEVVPECVTGEKDAVDANGNPVYQGIDTSFLVATLTAAIQEQQAIIESLTARVVALENQIV